MKKANLSEQAMISIIWTSVMSCVEWNKKEELVTEQAIKHLKVCNTVKLLKCLEYSLNKATKLENPAGTVNQ